MDDCIFCKIIKGELPSAKIYEDEHFVVVLDRFPATVGHVLLIPKVHVDNIFSIDDFLAEKIFCLATKFSKILQSNYGINNLNLLQNNGESAGQTVNHFHLHLIPRYDGDTVKLKWETLELTDEEFLDIKNQIKI